MRYPRNLALMVGMFGQILAACSSNSDSGVTVDTGRPGGAAGGSTLPSSSGSGASAGAIFNLPTGSAGTTTAPPPMTDVTVVITADNAYGFGYGDSTKIINYNGGVENGTSAEIFDCPIGTGPETYTVPASQANSGAYLYVIGYADRSTTQGVIAKFFREGADPVYTGMGAWQACATGMDFNPGTGGPMLDVINQQITLCNAGTTDVGTTSGGWVGTATGPGGRVAFGEDNSTDRDRPAPGNEFKIACEIDAAAHWMWYDWLPNRTTGSAFMWPGGDGNPTKDFIIFRLTADSIPEPIPK